MIEERETGKDQFSALSDETKGERESGYFGHVHLLHCTWSQLKIDIIINLDC